MSSQLILHEVKILSISFFDRNYSEIHRSAKRILSKSFKSEYEIKLFIQNYLYKHSSTFRIVYLTSYNSLITITKIYYAS